ncbi:MAG: creatininase family protein [Rhodospirillaceae bacterium]|nr:creatininase family protein [Rhodospirillaceae bacterium]
MADQRGEDAASIGSHAGIRETSELLAIDPRAVREDLLAAGADGVHGQPQRASAARGQKLLALKIDAALRQIRLLLGP